MNGIIPIVREERKTFTMLEFRNDWTRRENVYAISKGDHVE